MEQRFEDGDAIMFWQPLLYRYYAIEYARLTSPDVFVLEVRRDARASALIEKIRKTGHRRAWFVSAHKVRTDGLIEEIARSAPIVVDWKSPGTRVVLFDFAVR